MKGMLKSLKGLLRLKSNKITIKDKEYIKTGLDMMLEYNQVIKYKLFLSGSHSEVGRKYPNAKSDIDIYIMVDKKTYEAESSQWFGIRENDAWSKAMSHLVGLPIHIFFVDEFYDELIYKLEELK